jgi:hypothetical protein
MIGWAVPFLTIFFPLPRVTALRSRSTWMGCPFTTSLLSLPRMTDSTEQEDGLSEQEVFLATVSNMKPEEVFNRGLPR